MNEMMEILSPTFIGQDKIGITVDPASLPLLTGRVVTLHFDYSACYPAGVVKPLKLVVQPGFGSGAGYFEVEFTRMVPRSYAFTLQSAGQWLVLLKETGHNFWQGRILLDVKGELFTQIQTSRG